jgi:glycosyltransferase involved in cell wall biosynthesis
LERILFFETPVFTGATRVTRTIAKSLRNQYEVDFAVVNPNNFVKEDIRRQIEIIKPDILFSSFVSINADVIEVGKKYNLRVYIRTDYKLGDVTESIRERIYTTYPQADQLIAQTEEIANELRGIKGVKPDKVVVVENPIDEEELTRLAAEPNPFPNNNCFHYLWVGREDPIKDVDTLKKAFEIVHKNHEKTDLTLISNEPNPYRWMKNADCLIISSKSEASPNVLREALFLGTKVVSTDCSPTVRKLLPQDRVVPVGDYRRMAEAMSKLL